jgi:hypothetical protein
MKCNITGFNINDINGGPSKNIIKVAYKTAINCIVI